MRSAARFGVVCLLAAAAAAPALSADAVWYESNRTGAALRPLDPGKKSGTGFSLSVETSPAGEVRRLFSADGGETKRWERRFSESGAPVEESAYADGELESVTRYFETGLPKEELLYRDGRPDGRFLFEHREGLPAAVTFSRPDAGGDYRDEYLFLPSGEFRGVKRLYADGKLYTSIFTSLDGLPWEEWHSFEGAEILFRYDRRGNILFQEERRGEAVVERVDFVYAGEPPFRLTERRSHDIPDGRETVLRYDGEGRPERETVLEKGERVAVTLFSYREGRLVRKERRYRGGRELWEFRHDEKGNLTAEYHTVDNELKKTVRYDTAPEYSRVEEFYKNGLVFLRVFYRDGKVVRRELSGGAER